MSDGTFSIPEHAWGVGGQDMDTHPRASYLESTWYGELIELAYA